MLAMLFLALYLISGAAIIRFLLPGHRPLVRLWLGLSLGLLLLMWLPALCAMVMNFTIAAHFVSLAPLMALVALAYVFRYKREPRPFDAMEWKTLLPLAALLIVFTALSLYLQYTHTLRPGSDGLYVGQSTYGDLGMHLSFITGFVNAPFPPEYAMMTGEKLCYPFLVDSLSTTFYMGGFSLQWAVILPGTLLMALLYMGVFLMADRFMGGGKPVILAFLLFFVNGGLGFLYTFDLAGGELTQRLNEVLTGFYKTPTNQPTPYNLRWSNMICDLLVPQRTLLAGYAMLVPCLYLLFSSDKKTKTMVLLGLWGGALPMVHTHSFLALFLCTVGVMLYDLCHHEKGTMLKTFKPYFIYGCVAALPALMQMLEWTFARAGVALPSGKPFMEWHFNWSNNVNGKLVDNYLWFYLKNIGLPLIVLMMALCEKNGKYRRMAAGAFMIFAVAEVWRFQPNPYDNNKLMYVWYLLCTFIIADYMRVLWRSLRAVRGRYLLAVFALVAMFTSGTLTIAREAVSDYRAFSTADVEVAVFTTENTNREDVFLTGTQHLNPVLVLCGRKIVVSADIWLYYHGYDTTERAGDVKRFYEDPAENMDVLDKYGVTYVYVSSHELSNYNVDMAALNAMFDKVYEANGYYLFAVKGA